MAVPLALFPLSTVLVPGLVLPLHVFEQRYRVLVGALAALPDSAVREFGVVAIRAGHEVGAEGVSGERALHAVGCTAELRDVTPRADGGFDIVAVGRSRFRLLGLDPDAGTPYLTGRVELLGEPDGVSEAELELLAQDVALRFAAYRQKLGVDQTPISVDPGVLSYLVAAATLMDLPRRQQLLEEPSTAERLRAEHALLRQETGIIGVLRSAPAPDLLHGALNLN